MANYTISSGNVFKDLELPSPDERLAKAKFAYEINSLIAAHGMTQKDAASYLEISRYKMTQLRNGRINTFTVDDLSSLLEKLECHTQHNTCKIGQKAHVELSDLADKGLLSGAGKGRRR